MSRITLVAIVLGLASVASCDHSGKTTVGEGNTAGGLSEKVKIEALIAHIEGLDGAVFVRNGSDYDAKTAGKFLRGKWDHAADVKTAKDFIEKVASVSGTSGKPYLIRFKDGKEVKSGEYLSAELEKLEKRGR